jgi:esterase/lipase superfamily enzyme
MVLSSGCAGRTPIGESAAELIIRTDAVTISVPFVTNRDLETDRRNATYYGDGRGTSSSGVCSVVLEEPDQLQGHAQVAEVRQLPTERVLGEIDRSKRAVMYVHGYNIGFEKGCRRAARLQQNLGIVGSLLLFSWPSDGNYLNYVRDVADLQWSEPELERVLIELAGEFEPGQIDLIGHSLGARGLVQALVDLSRTGLRDGTFGRLVLAAPDIDRDLFQRDLRRLARVVSGITIYVSSKDKALGASNRLNGYPRLGQSGAAATLPEVAVVDVSTVDVRGFSGHLYHLYNAAVVEDLRRLFGTLEGEGAYHRVMADGIAQLQSN